MATVEFVGQSAQTQTAPGAGTSRLLNLYREPVTEGDLTRYILRPVPGQTVLATPESQFQRVISWVNGEVYTVSGGNLNLIEDDGTLNVLAPVIDDENTSISGNLGNVGVVAGGRYYVWDGSTVTEIAGAAFDDFGSIETVGQRMLLTERGGRRIQWSDVADPATLNALNFATTEAGEDNNIRGVALNGNYWVFKERSIEIWYNTGASDEAEAFARVSGGVITTGLKDFNLITKIRGGLFFVGSDGIVYVTQGSGLQPISTPPVMRDIREKNPTHCFYFEHEGHKFCVVRFSDRPAWVFNFATNEWSERSEGVLHGPWDAVGAVQRSDGSWLVGSQLGIISRLDNAASDKGGPLYRRAISRTLRNDSQRFRVAEMEFYADFGRVETDPSVELMFSHSGDRGKNWSNQRNVSMGDLGVYNNRALFRTLGQFREFTARLDITHGYEAPVFSDVRVRLA